jgi:hypothetical protein
VKQFRALRNRWWLTGWWIVLAGWWIVLGGALPAARAAHVVPMTVERMADHAAQVIVGEVTKVAAHWAEAPRRIETTIEFANVEFLKGALPRAEAEPFVLTVPGGRIGEMQMRVCCAPEFQVGQRWCLFLLASSPTYPVVGLYNGALRIESDAKGVARMRSAGGQAVTGLDPAGFLRVAGPTAEHHHPVTRAARNVRIVSRTARPPETALSYAEFRQQVQPILDASIDHAPTHPAGRYVPKPIVPRALQPAAGPSAPSGPRERAGPPRGSDAVPQVPVPRRSEVRP